MLKNYNGYTYLGIFILLESLFPIFSYFALQHINTLILVFCSTFIALVFGLIIFVKEKHYAHYKKKETLIPVFLSCLFIGTGGVLYFFGIQYSSPSIASVLILSQSFFAFLIFNILGKEQYNYIQVIGAICTLIGGIIVLYDGESLINFGAAIMLLCCFISTIGNFYMKQAVIKGANPFFILFNRNLFVLILMGILSFLFVGKFDIITIQENFVWIFLIGFFVLFISKASWIQALGKLNSFVAISLFPVIPLFVILFSYLLLNEIPTMKEVLGFIPIILGTILLVKKPTLGKQ